MPKKFHPHPTPNPSPDNTNIIKNYAFKLKLFTVHRKKDKSELKDEKEQIKRTFYKCPYCDKTYSNVTRYEVHLRTHVIIYIQLYFILYRQEKNHMHVLIAKKSSTKKEI